MDQETINTPNPVPAGPPAGPKDPKKEKTNGSLVAGIILITIGILFLMNRFLPRIHFGDLWPVLLIVGGIILVYNAYKDKNKNQS
ncbi:MAG TPA: DUF5668 domain-containing protein [Bacteroidales bacterium]|nr:DUF5668 domain-containing protein [Bacteroidales bacterium]HNS46943.1 DUF5668 domain-containing protein [Bacteroidales bacterium]